MHETTSENALDGGKVEMKKESDFQISDFHKVTHFLTWLSPRSKLK